MSTADDALVPLPAKVSRDVKARLEAEAASCNRKVSAHVRHILDEHFVGTSVDQVKDELGELASEVSRLREMFESGDPGGTRQATEQVRSEVRELRELIGELAAVVHHTSGAFMSQLSLPDRGRFADQLDRLMARYKDGTPE